MDSVTFAGNYLRIVFGHAWVIALLLAAFVGQFESIFGTKLNIPRWVRVGAIIAVIFFAQARVYRELAENPPLVLRIAPPPAPTIVYAAREPVSRNEPSPPPQPTINSAPYGIANGAPNYGNQTVNNSSPEPNISFVNDNEEPATQNHTPPWYCVRISVDRPMDSPQFAVSCDRACKAVGGGPLLPHGGPGGGDQWGSIPNHPDIAAFIIGQPNPLPSNVKYRACVASENDKPIRILSVKKLILTGDAK